jgi:SprB repeat
MQNTTFSKIIIRLFFLITIFFSNVTNSQTTTFPSGSLIVDMGVVPQTVANGLKPYGMLYALVSNQGTPINWIINSSKVKDGVDFTYNGYDYKGGPFIISAEFLTPAVNALIATWTAQGVVTRITTSPLTVPVFMQKAISAVPRWTLDKDNGSIIQKFFTNAGIPPSSYGGLSGANWKTPAQLDGCDDIFAMPHADPVWATHSNLKVWIEINKGSVWLGCHAGSALENMFNPANPSEQTNFLSEKTGTATGAGPYSQNALLLWGNHLNGTLPYSYDFGGDPIMQFMGSLDAATTNGSEQIYIPLLPGWRPTTTVSCFDPDHPQILSATTKHRASVIAYGPAYGNTNNGSVMIEAGHDIAKNASPPCIAAQRAFFNFAFLEAAKKTAAPTISIVNGIVVTPGAALPITFTVNAPYTINDFTVAWSSNCGGTFTPSTTAPSVNFTPAAVVGSVPCNITLKITDACGRQSFDTKSIIVQCAITVATTIVEPCGASSNGSISYTVTGGNAPYTYSWTRTGGGTGSGSGTTISGLASGTYSITVTAANGCATTITRTLTTAPAIVVTATPTAAVCFGGNTGSINTTVSGGAPGYTYLWGDGATTANRSGLAAGTYNVTVTDTRGCTGTASATVTQPAVINATTTITPANCFGQASGTITLVVAGGTAPYTYLWNNGATTQNRTSLAAGTYSVVITDSRGCTLAVNSLAVTQPAAALSLSTSVVNITCNGINNGSATVTPAGGTAPYAYNWNGTPTGDGTATITGLAAGSYPVTVTDARGCTAVATATITETSPLTVNAAFVPPTCPPSVATLGNNGSITLTVAGGTAPRTYAWTASGGGIVPPGQSTNQNLTLLVAGTYSVTITDANGCTKTTSVTLTNINPNPVTPGVIIKN